MARKVGKKDTKLPTIIKLLIGCAITATGLYFFLKDIDIAGLKQKLLSVSAPVVIGTVILAYLTLYLRSLRWHIILPKKKGTDKRYLFHNTVIGFMINNILPARIGEVIRVYILHKKNNYPVSMAVGSIIQERVIDMVVFALFFAIPAVIHPSLSSLRYTGYLIIIGVGIFFITLLTYIFFKESFLSFSNWLLMILPSSNKLKQKIRSIGTEVQSTTEWLFSPKYLFAVLLISFFTSFCYSASIILLSYNSGIYFGFFEGLFSQACAAFGSAIPLAPGYIGTVHAALNQALSLFDMDKNSASAITILYHALHYIPVTILGLIFFFGLDLSFKDIKNAQNDFNKDTKQNG